MNRCTECNFPLEEGLLTCPQCGADISSAGARDGTINVSANAGDQTVDFEAPIGLEHRFDESQESSQELVDGGW